MSSKNTSPRTVSRTDGRIKVDVRLGDVRVDYAPTVEVHVRQEQTASASAAPEGALGGTRWKRGFHNQVYRTSPDGKGTEFRNKYDVESQGGKIEEE